MSVRLSDGTNLGKLHYSTSMPSLLGGVDGVKDPREGEVRGPTVV
jgi:hypothetical protein